MTLPHVFANLPGPVPLKYLDDNFNSLANSSTNVAQLSSIASLRLAPKTGPTTIVVTGYRTANDGGGGLYVLNPADTTTADDGGSVIVAADGGRWYLQNNGTYYWEQFGAIPDANLSGGGTDNTVAIQNCIYAAWYRRNAGLSGLYGGSALGRGGFYRVTSHLYWPPAVTFGGMGSYVTTLVFPVGFSDALGVVYSDASVAPFSGVPTQPNHLIGLAIVSDTGGAAAPIKIININKNATFIDDVWVSGAQNGGTGILVNNSDARVTNWTSEYCTYGLYSASAASTISNGIAYQCDYGVLVDNGAAAVNNAEPCVYTSIRTEQCNFVGIEVLTGSSRHQFIGCSAANEDNTKYSVAGFRATSASLIDLIDFEGDLGKTGAASSTTAYGVHIKTCTSVNVKGGHCYGWLEGYLGEGGSGIQFLGVSGLNNRNRGGHFLGGNDMQVTGGQFTGNGVNAGTGTGFESENTAASSIHQITGINCDGTGGVQKNGFKASVSLTSAFTDVTGVTAPFNATANITYSGVVDNILTDGMSSIGKAWSSLNVTGLSTITLPMGPCFSPSGTVVITGTPGTTITTITATGFAGARATVISKGSTYAFGSGGNIANFGAIASLSVNQPKDLICDGTTWWVLT